MTVRNLSNSVADINNFLFDNQENIYYENLFINNWFAVTASTSTWSTIGYGFYNEDQLVGWILFNVSRPTGSLNITSLCIIDRSFSGAIFRSVFACIRAKMNRLVPKLTFATMVDSHAEKIWDKIIKKFDGVIVGIKTNECIDQRGNFRDMKLYEILNPLWKQY